jgi:RNA polymerase sigma factor (sigma-70 family)
MIIGPRKRLGPYEIPAPLGAGGMGEGTAGFHGAAQAGRDQPPDSACDAGRGAMRRILVNHAKARGRLKRGGLDAQRVPFDDAFDSFQQRAIDLEALDEALKRLAVLDQTQARVVELRFFGGLTVEESADVLGVSPRTAHREWDLAKAWLRGEVSKGDL